VPVPPVVPLLLLELEPVPVVPEPDVAPGVDVLGAGVVTEPEPEADPLAPGVVDGEADGVRSAGLSVVRVVLDSVHAVSVTPSASAQKPVTNLFMADLLPLGVRVHRTTEGNCNAHACHALDRLLEFHYYCEGNRRKAYRKRSRQ
jgi:hypothetical protein